MHPNRIKDFLDDDDETLRQPIAAPERFQFDPYGANDAPNESTHRNIPWPFPVQFTKSDPAADNSDYRSRAFHAALGRWLEHDPIGYVEGANHYPAIT